LDTTTAGFYWHPAPTAQEKHSQCNGNQTTFEQAAMAMAHGAYWPIDKMLTELVTELGASDVYHLVMTNSLPWKITMLLRTVNHLFRLGPSSMAMLVITRG